MVKERGIAIGGVYAEKGVTQGENIANKKDLKRDLRGKRWGG